MNILQKFSVFAAVLFGAFIATTAFAAPANALFEASVKETCKGANLSEKNANCADGASALNTTLVRVINIITLIVGIVAVIMIVINGLRFITANGDSGSITNARNGIIYAIVGLVIVSFAQIIVRFVINRV